MSERYSVPLTNAKQLIDYFVTTYEISEIRAAEIISTDAYKSIINEGINYGSYVWYVGDHIADIAGLEPQEDEDEDIAYESDDT